MMMMLLLAAQDVEPTCPGTSTVEVNRCLAGQLNAAEGNMRRYLAAARERLANSAREESSTTKLVDGLDRSQTAWTAYRDAHCDSIFDFWSSGTIRTGKEIACRIALTEQRTYIIWNDWLIYPDSTPSVLPEPKTSR